MCRSRRVEFALCKTIKWEYEYCERATIAAVAAAADGYGYEDCDYGMQQRLICCADTADAPAAAGASVEARTAPCDGAGCPICPQRPVAEPPAPQPRGPDHSRGRALSALGLFARDLASRGGARARHAARVGPGAGSGSGCASSTSTSTAAAVATTTWPWWEESGMAALAELDEDLELAPFVGHAPVRMYFPLPPPPAKSKPKHRRTADDERSSFFFDQQQQPAGFPHRASAPDTPPPDVEAELRSLERIRVTGRWKEYTEWKEMQQEMARKAYWMGRERESG